MLTYPGQDCHNSYMASYILSVLPTSSSLPCLPSPSIHSHEGLELVLWPFGTAPHHPSRKVLYPVYSSRLVISIVWAQMWVVSPARYVPMSHNKGAMYHLYLVPAGRRYINVQQRRFSRCDEVYIPDHIPPANTDTSEILPASLYVHLHQLILSKVWLACSPRLTPASANPSSVEPTVGGFLAVLVVSAVEQGPGRINDIIN